MGYIWIILAIIFILVIGGAFLFFYFRLGIVFSKALMGVGTHGGGIKWIPGIIRQIKKGGRFRYSFFRAGLLAAVLAPPIKISVPPQDSVAQLGKGGRIVFLRMHQTPDGKTYSSFINYYEQFKVKPSNETQTFQFLAPVNENVMSWAIDSCIETNNRYPFLIKHPHFVTGAVLMAGLVSMVMVVVVINVM